jgi:Transcriptional Coactivator p15 (PC4)
MESRLIAEWPKANDDVVRMTLGFYKGRLRLDIREYYRHGKDYRPSKRGINLPAERLSDLKKATLRGIKIEKRLRRKRPLGA